MPTPATTLAWPWLAGPIRRGHRPLPQKVLEIQPGHADAHNGLGMALAGGGRFDEAIVHFRKALEIQPDYADASYNLGLALAGCGRCDEAFVRLQPFLGSPVRQCRLAKRSLGNVLAARGQFQAALAHYRRACEIAPDHLAAQKDLAWLRATCPEASLRNGNEALELAQRANRHCDGRRPDVLDALAAAYAEWAGFRKPWSPKLKPWSVPRSKTRIPDG